MSERSKSRVRQSRAQPESLEKLFKSLEEKVLNIPILNGGFESLMFKVDKIEESMSGVNEKIDKIHVAVYDPDQGLFARVKSTETKTIENITLVKNDVDHLRTAHETHINVDQDAATDMKLYNEIVDRHQRDLERVMIWRDRINSILKWLLVTLASGFLALTGKLLYEFIAGRIQFN